MDFEKQICSILDGISIADEDFPSFAKESHDVGSELVNHMKRNDATFQQYFKASTFGGGANKGANAIDEITLYLQLDFGQQLKPISFPGQPGLIKIECPNDKPSEFADNGFISTTKLHKWIKTVWERILQGVELQIKCSTRRSFTIKYNHIAQGTNIRHIFGIYYGKQREFDIQIVPAFAFEPTVCPLSKIVSTNSMWFAVPKGRRNSEHCFSAVAPGLEEAVLKNKENVNSAMRLMKAMRNANKMPQLSSYMIKSLFLTEMEKMHKRSFWKKPIGEMLLFMMDKLICAFRHGKLGNYLELNDNLLEPLGPNTIAEYLVKLSDAKKLYYFQRDCCRFSVHPNPSLFNLFGAKIEQQNGGASGDH